MTRTRPSVRPVPPEPELAEPVAPSVDAPQGTDDIVRSVARGGAINLIGSVVYGASNFLFLGVLTNRLGVEAAGAVLVVIALFTITARISELGCTTGLVRNISSRRALGREDLLRSTVVSAAVPVVMMATTLAALWLALVPMLADRFGRGGDAAVIADILRAVLPFLPFAALHTALIQGTRGFDRMGSLAVVEKIGRSGALPVVALAISLAGGDATAVARGWALTWPVALVASVVAMGRLVRQAERTTGRRGGWIPEREDFVAFWRFTLPRAAGQVLEVSVNWFDTLLIGAVLTTAAAGIYASGTRYLLIGIFTVEAIMQAVGPRVSGLLARGERRQAEAVLQRATGWTVMALWPIFLGVLVMTEPLLGLFGPEVVEARWALIFLSVAVLLSALNGPAASVILMAGRSRTALFNAMLAVVLNVGGNILLVPRFGISAAGAVWGVSLVTMSTLPAVQALRNPGVRVWSPIAAQLVFAAVVAVVPAALLARWLLGPTVVAVAVAAVAGLAIYAPAVRRLNLRGVDPR